MKVIAKAGNENLAVVYIARDNKNRIIEFAQSVEPPYPREKKWVFLLSTLYGCPVKCIFCDAWGEYCGKIEKENIIYQINYLLSRYNYDGFVCEKLKIQFARVGEPSFNENVIDVLEELPELIKNHKIYPSISTIAPFSSKSFFEKLIEIKKKFFSETFQLQFSIHTTDEKLRDEIIPIKKWSFKEIAEYGERFYDEGGRKITLNFIYSKKLPVDINKVISLFPKNKFLIKVTPVNPTYNALSSNIYDEFKYDENVWFEKLKKEGYDVIVSIGELEENRIGSNCGQHITNYRIKNKKLTHSYTYELSYID